MSGIPLYLPASGRQQAGGADITHQLYKAANRIVDTGNLAHLCGNQRFFYFSQPLFSVPQVCFCNSCNFFPSAKFSKTSAVFRASFAEIEVPPAKVKVASARPIFVIPANYFRAPNIAKLPPCLERRPPTIEHRPLSLKQCPPNCIFVLLLIHEAAGAKSDLLV
jgi:hypothetical protein